MHHLRIEGKILPSGCGIAVMLLNKQGTQRFSTVKFLLQKHFPTYKVSYKLLFGFLVLYRPF